MKYFREITFPEQHHALSTVVRLFHRPKFQIFSTESNIMVKVVRYLPKSETAVYKCLLPFKQKRLFMSILFTKVAGLQPKEKNSTRDVFLWVCLIFQNAFLRNTFWWWLHLLNAIHFLCCVDLISKMLLSTLALFWLSINISRGNTVSRLLTPLSGSPRQLVDLLLIKQVIRPKCS